jgi:hypothetical protein
MSDKVIMLLSSDWFFPYWDRIGMKIDDDKKKESLHHGCRKIVEQFMSNAKEYWHISFAPGRVERTRSMLESLLRKTSLPESTAGILMALASAERAETEDMGMDFVMFALTERLQTITAEADSVYLSAEVREIVTEISAKSEAEVDWEQLCLSSATTWDRYLKGITPEQPTALADFLIAEVLVKSFQPLWAKVTAKLNAKQQGELIDWYRASAKSIMGLDLSTLRIN